MRYSKYSGRGNFFSLPNEVFQLGLNAGELSVYSFLRRCENHGTHQCWPSIRTIGQAVRMSENIKLRTLLKQYGYRRRSAKLLEHLEQCMAFYQLQPYLRGGIPCKLSEISIDEMVVFRLSDEKHLS